MKTSIELCQNADYVSISASVDLRGTNANLQVLWFYSVLYRSLHYIEQEAPQALYMHYIE